MRNNAKATVGLAISVVLLVFGREMVKAIPDLMLHQDNGLVWTINWGGAALIGGIFFVMLVKFMKKPTLLKTVAPSLLTFLIAAMLLEMFGWHPEIGIKILKETISPREWLIIGVVAGIFLIPFGGFEIEKMIKKFHKEAKKRKAEWEKKRTERKEAKEAAKAAKLAARAARKQGA